MPDFTAFKNKRQKDLKKSIKKELAKNGKRRDGKLSRARLCKGYDQLSMSIQAKLTAIDEFKDRISEGDIPERELDKILEYFHRDFDELQQMDIYWENSIMKLRRK